MILSSKKAAEFLNVNESTVKRWADKGKLKSFKTPGGHRKFNFEDLRKVSEENNFVIDHLNSFSNNEKTLKEISSRNYKSISLKFRKYLLKGDTGTAFEIIYLLYLDKIPVAEIFDEVVNSSMKSIGELWEKGKLGVYEEHIASSALLSVIHRFENEITDKYYTKSKRQKKAICTGPESEFHYIGLHCLQITLKHLGWNVIFPGSNLPSDSVINLLKSERPDILCLSFKSNLSNGELNKNLKDILKYTDKYNIKVFYGGELQNEFKENDIKGFKYLKTFTKYIKDL